MALKKYHGWIVQKIFQVSQPRRPTRTAAGGRAVPLPGRGLLEPVFAHLGSGRAALASWGEAALPRAHSASPIRGRGGCHRRCSARVVGRNPEEDRGLRVMVATSSAPWIEPGFSTGQRGQEGPLSPWGHTLRGHQPSGFSVACVGVTLARAPESGGSAPAWLAEGP